MNAGDELKKAIRDLARSGGAPAVLRWAVVETVDWEEKTMTATGVADDLEYYDVQLGLGGLFFRPAVKSTVLIGIVEGNEAAAFLLSAGEIEKIEVKTSVEVEIDGGENGGTVLSGALVEKLNRLEDDVNALKTAISGWAPVSMDGGAALKTALTSWTGRQLTKTARKDVENKKIKQ